jgi:hypothetical protein
MSVNMFSYLLITHVGSFIKYYTLSIKRTLDMSITPPDSFLFKSHLNP